MMMKDPRDPLNRSIYQSFFSDSYPAFKVGQVVSKWYHDEEEMKDRSQGIRFYIFLIIPVICVSNVNRNAI
jgi:hypothetical protein